MKNGLLVCFGTSYTKNIGDYIQSIAQEQFFNKINCFCEREHLNEIEDSEIINLIMNGWFMWSPQNFPPSKCINPLFISFHIVPSIKDAFFTEETIEYLRRNEPIGARDLGTKQLLEKYGINSYFSNCLTLTLGLNYKENNKNNDILFVDPYYEISGNKRNIFNILYYFKSLILLVKYSRKVYSLSKRFVPENKTIWSFFSKKLENLISACHFFDAYKDAFDEDLLLDSIIITHNVKKQNYPTNNALLEYARQLIKQYAKSKLVITSRIHCALPCLAVETPVLYVSSPSLENINLRSPGRMGGIINLFHTLNFENNKCSRFKSKKIGYNSKIENKPDYKYYRDILIRETYDFIKKSNEQKENMY